MSEPRKGFRVAPITEAELKDITRVRATIESLCLENAIQNGDLKWETNIVSTQFELSKMWDIFRPERSGAGQRGLGGNPPTVSRGPGCGV